MKKTWKRLTALMLAVCAAASVPAVSASALWYWGIAANDQFTDMQQIDDKGMFKWIGYGGVPGTPRDYQVFTYHYSFDKEFEVTDAETGETKTELRHFEGDPVYVVSPRENCLRIVLRKDIDHDAAEQKMFEILEKYYSGITEFSQIINPEIKRMYFVSQATYGVSDLECTYDLVDNSEAFLTEEAKTAGSQEISDGIMRDLAQAGLISEFYTWGQTAHYQQACYSYPTAYYPTSQKWNSSYTAVEADTYDWDAIEAYVKEQYPECEFVHVTLEDTELAKKLGYYMYEQDKAYFGNCDEMYAVIPPDGTTFPEHFAIAAELYEQLGIAAEWLCPANASAPITGQNALAISGDVNIDCSVDVSDAVLLFRFCAEDTAANITQTAKQNADANQDGDLSADDVIVILKMIAKLI